MSINCGKSKEMIPEKGKLDNMPHQRVSKLGLKLSNNLHWDCNIEIGNKMSFLLQ